MIGCISSIMDRCDSAMCVAKHGTVMTVVTSLVWTLIFAIALLLCSQ